MKVEELQRSLEEKMNEVKIGILKNSDYYWNLILEDGTTRIVMTLNLGEMKKLAKSIPSEILMSVELDEELERRKAELNGN